MLIPFKEIVRRYGRVKNVLHVGASSGQEAKDYRNSGVEHVTWIEAIPSVFEELKKNIALYSGMFAVNACVSDVSGETVNFKITNNEGQSSSFLDLGIHKQEHPDVHVIQELEMNTIRLDDLVYAGSIASTIEFDFLNFDIQGAELKAMKGFGDFIKNAKVIYCEVNKDRVYVDCPLIEDIDTYLLGHGFKRVETKWCGSFSWGDAVYINKKR